MVLTVSDEKLIQLSRAGNKLNLPFTGERVVPGAVETQLWKEHISRYRYACLFASGKRVLDAGCGTGYGTELLATVAQSAVGFDLSRDAIRYAAASFPTVKFICGSATAFPLSNASFNLITAFEVIEHLADWDLLLRESARVLTADGLFLVSTPNKEYYAESRGNSGPNPFHIHEFELPEFRTALERVFPFVQILAQNQQEAITFTSDLPAQYSEASISPNDNLPDAHFFVAVCSHRAFSLPYFADVSSTHNLLREREKHIRGLQGELADAQQKHSGLLAEHRKFSLELEKVRQDSDLSIQESRKELLATQRQLEELKRELQLVKGSGWIRLGRKLGLGPWSTGRAAP